jgi:hypothetical protein
LKDKPRTLTNVAKEGERGMKSEKINEWTSIDSRNKAKKRNEMKNATEYNDTKAIKTLLRRQHTNKTRIYKDLQVAEVINIYKRVLS